MQDKHGKTKNNVTFLLGWWRLYFIEKSDGCSL